MRIVLNRIAVPNPSIDNTTPNLQAGRTLRNEDGLIEHLQQNAIMAPRHMKQSREIIKTSSVKRGFSPRFPHNLGYPLRRFGPLKRRALAAAHVPVTCILFYACRYPGTAALPGDMHLL
ncbi:hypothetical protein [Rhizobium ruizarguesonis]|uniref:hypothetical protein n=1 Tax=Rhizobium ruizarguesonis TaxID=2081791 RepID=UPI003714BAC9